MMHAVCVKNKDRCTKMGSTNSKDRSQMKIPDGIYFNFYSFLELGRTSLWAIFEHCTIVCKFDPDTE
jgi:hypothetical protein